MMRYGLRNKDRIKAKLGENELKVITTSLDAFFKSGAVPAEEWDDKAGFDKFSVPSIDGRMIELYIIGRKFDVVRLAFKRFFNNF